MPRVENLPCPGPGNHKTISENTAIDVIGRTLGMIPESRMRLRVPEVKYGHVHSTGAHRRCDVRQYHVAAAPKPVEPEGTVCGNELPQYSTAQIASKSQGQRSGIRQDSV